MIVPGFEARTITWVITPLRKKSKAKEPSASAPRNRATMGIEAKWSRLVISRDRPCMLEKRARWVPRTAPVPPGWLCSCSCRLGLGEGFLPGASTQARVLSETAVAAGALRGDLITD